MLIKNLRNDHLSPRVWKTTENDSVHSVKLYYRVNGGVHIFEYEGEVVIKVEYTDTPLTG